MKRFNDEWPTTVADIERENTASYQRGVVDGLTRYAWWKDGVQYVGTCGTTLAQAVKEATEAAND